MSALFRPAPLRKRLWQGAAAVCLLVGTFVAGNFVISRDRAVTGAMLGHDFVAFYTAGTFARTGQFDLLYKLNAVQDLQRQVARENHLEMRDVVAPFWNPPFYAWIFAPLSWFSFPVAAMIWTILNLLALAGAAALLCRMLPGQADWRSWALMPVLLLLSMPLLQAITHGQNTPLSLLVLCGVVTAWRRQWNVTAGMLCGLLFYKPQLAVVVALVLVINRGMRVCLGLAFALGSLCLITAFTMPNSIGDYLHRLPINLHFIQAGNEYLWERHVTFKAFWRLLLQGRAAGDTAAAVQIFTALSCAALMAGLVWAIFRDRRAGFDDIFTGETRLLRRDRLIAATIAAMPLLMPFYFDYDLLLLSIPAVLFAGEMMARAPGRPDNALDRLLVGCWIGLYLWLMIAPAVGAAAGVNLTVILLAMVALLLIRRAGYRIEPQQIALRAPQVVRVTVRRAA